MNHDVVDSNPNSTTSRVYSLAKIYKSVINHIFMINKITKKQKSPFFRASAEFTERRREKWILFFLKYKIEYNGFITILGSVGTKGMMPTTNFC